MIDDTSADWQEKCRQFVRQHVFYCVSGLVYTLAQNAGMGDGTTELQDLCDEAQTLFEPVASLDDKIEVLREHGYRVMERSEGRWIVTDTDEEDAWKNALEEASYRIRQVGDTNDWELVNDDDEVVVTLVDVADEGVAVMAACHFLELAPSYSEDAEGDDQAEAVEEFLSGHYVDFSDEIREQAGEIYEHWIVSEWLADRLRDRSQRVGSLDNLTVWGRGCTGQAILLDSVIQDIVKERHRD